MNAVLSDASQDVDGSLVLRTLLPQEYLKWMSIPAEAIRLGGEVHTGNPAVAPDGVLRRTNKGIPMSQFMLLLYDNPSAFANVTPEQMQQIIQEYGAWAGKLGQEGKLVGGEKLKDEGGKVIKVDGKQVKVTDGPYSETKEVIGGYFLIKADNYNQAVEISKTCPHAKYGPRIDVREVDPSQS